MQRTLAATLVTILVLSADPAVAGQEPQPAPHVALSLGLFASAGLMAGVKGSMAAGPPACRLTADGTCDPAGLTTLDRWALGLHSAAWGTVSDVGQYIAIAAPAALLLTLAWLPRDAPAELSPLWDVLIWTETMAVCAAFDQALKITLRRPRPIWYSRPAGGGDAQVSFPSGHAFAASTGTTALTTLFWHRFPDSPWRWGVLAAGIVVTGVTGVGRVEAGKHFPSDVLAGWVLGATLGYVQPTLLKRNIMLAWQPLTRAPDDDGRALTVAVTFP